MTVRPINPGLLPRRRLLAAGALALAAGRYGPSDAHEAAGPVTPRQGAPTGMQMSTVDGRSTSLRDLLKSNITAVQLMFTGCSATCPIQGAIFADAQSQLAPTEKHLRLLSISIDPLNDDAPALARWLSRYGAQPVRWTAVVPAARDVDRLLEFLRGRALGADRHTSQAYLFDRQGRLAFRSVDMPPGGELVRLMRALSAAG